MKMIKAVVRPEKSYTILAELAEAGFPAATKISVLGRGKQRGLKMGEMYYEEIPKEMIVIVAEDKDVTAIIDIITKFARSTNDGSYGDGKIFILPIDEVYTISTKSNTL